MFIYGTLFFQLWPLSLVRDYFLNLMFSCEIRSLNFIYNRGLFALLQSFHQRTYYLESSWYQPRSNASDSYRLLRSLPFLLLSHWCFLFSFYLPISFISYIGMVLLFTIFNSRKEALHILLLDRALSIYYLFMWSNNSNHIMYCNFS